MKPDQRLWIERRWPLIELDMTRASCKAWWAGHAPEDAPPLARSACIGCPFHSSREWQSIAEDGLLEDAAEVEAAINATTGKRTKNYLHRRRIPSWP